MPGALDTCFCHEKLPGTAVVAYWVYDSTLSFLKTHLVKALAKPESEKRMWWQSTCGIFQVYWLENCPRGVASLEISHCTCEELLEFTPPLVMALVHGAQSQYGNGCQLCVSVPLNILWYWGNQHRFGGSLSLVKTNLSENSIYYLTCHKYLLWLVSNTGNLFHRN